MARGGRRRWLASAPVVHAEHPGRRLAVMTAKGARGAWRGRDDEPVELGPDDALSSVPIIGSRDRRRGGSTASAGWTRRGTAPGTMRRAR